MSVECTLEQRPDDLAISCAIRKYESSKSSLGILLGFQLTTLFAAAAFVKDYSIIGSDFSLTVGFILIISSIAISTVFFVRENLWDGISPVDDDYEEVMRARIEKDRSLMKRYACDMIDLEAADLQAEDELSYIEKLKRSYILMVRAGSSYLELFLGLSVLLYTLSIAAFIWSLLSPLFSVLLVTVVLILSGDIRAKYRAWKRYDSKLA